MGTYGTSDGHSEPIEHDEETEHEENWEESDDDDD